MLFKTLLAKSWDRDNSSNPPTHAKLIPHLRAVAAAGDTIITTVGQTIISNLELDESIWLPRLRQGLRTACLLHDIGKANEAFQSMVRGDLHYSRQPIRHELISLFLIEETPIQSWIRERLTEFGGAESPHLINAVIGAVAGHHVKMDQDWCKAARAIQSGGCGTEVNVLINHPDLRQLFGDVGVQVPKVISLVEGSPDSIFDLRSPFLYRHMKWRKFLLKNREWFRFAAVLKALLVAADVAGSALLSEYTSPKKWVSKTLEKRLIKNDAMNVIEDRIGLQNLRPFQRDVGASKGRITLVEAGCGSGKTLAAYLWAENNAIGKKLFFCYPTTGTATEGFKDYVASSKVEADLIHSRSSIDLEGIAVVSDEDREERFIKIESLRAWRPKVIICTVDSVLSLLRSNRRGLYSSPAILSGAFIFDELHAYDDKMFASVLALMAALPGARFLIMTASLPEGRKKLLMKEFSETVQIPSPLELEILLRYRFRRASSMEALFFLVDEYVKKGKKVLWITNTVARAQGIYDQASDREIQVLTYHSRFKYVDRDNRHRTVIAGFDPSEKKGMLAVTTQVAEMSLDLDADLMISEIAPMSALIQRLGRLNRRITPENRGTPREVWFVQTDSALPYGNDELNLAKRWIDQFIKKDSPLSQQDLARAFNDLSPKTVDEADTRMEWLDSGWLAEPGAVREGGYSVSAIFEEDLQGCKRDRQLLIKKTIPLNFNDKMGMDNWMEFKGHLIAPEGSIHYDKKRGASWPKP